MPLVRKSEHPPAPEDLEVATPPSLQSSDSDERWAAARLIASRRDGTALLAGALHSERDKRVRQALFSGLTAMASSESIEALVGFLRSDDAQLRTGALDALRATGSAVATFLPSLIRDPEADIRLLACELARSLPAEQCTKLLCDLLDSERDANVCASALEVLAEMGEATAMPALARCADRFRGVPFLEFAVRHTMERIGSQPDGTS